jgi:hypothetical protein
MIVDSLNFYSSLGGKIALRYLGACLIFAERKVLVIIVGITMNVLIEMRTEVKQTLSMVTERSLIIETIFTSKENGQGRWPHPAHTSQGHHR